MITFDDYVRLRGGRLVRLARLLAHDRHLAEDLVQEVLAKAFVRWSKITKGGDPDLYLRRMLVNAHVSWRRRRSASELVTDEVWEWQYGADIGTAAAERDEVWRLITSLPPRQRVTLILRYYEDLDDATIAEIMQCSAVTVRTQAMRGLATLRGRLTEAPTTVAEGSRR